MIVFKLGGSVLKRLHPDFFAKCRELKEANMPFLIVHGGGPFVSDWMKKLGQKPVFIEGRRVTDEETLKIVQMVLAGQVNKQLVSQLIKEGIPALGLSGIDLGLISVKPKDEKLGYVGEVTGLNQKVLKPILKSGWVPVISSIGIGDEGQVFNVNADEVAGSVAQEMKARQLVMISDVDGIFIKKEGEKKILRRLTPQMVERLIQEGQIKGGMIPKVRSAVRCLDGQVKEVWIINGEKPWQMDEKGAYSPGTCLQKEEVKENVSVSNL